MNATQTAALPAYDTQNGAHPAQSRPALRVVRLAENPAAPPSAPPPSTTAPSTTAPSTAAAHPAAVRPVALRPAAASYVTASRTAAAPLRLTRRGRIVVAGLAVLLLAVLSLVIAGAAQATSHSAPRGVSGSGVGQVVVRPGESLWSVAENADPDADTRLVIQQIVQLNALSGDTVFAGQRLWVPRS
jgi:LysM repeat protein